jgi:hypothetical protein
MIGKKEEKSKKKKKTVSGRVRGKQRRRKGDHGSG